jgi:hypothetical protein
LYLALRDGPRRFRQGSTCPALLRYPLRVRSLFTYAPFTLYGTPFHGASIKSRIGNSTVADPTTPVGPEDPAGLGYIRFRSPLLSESRLLSFPPGTEMVHFPGFARSHLCIQWDVIRFYRIGFPHSEIPGSMPTCGSPRLIAALPRPSSPSSAKASTVRP